ncbi:MAG: thioredoxin domain-containing protein [Patescibacteria group bacterium]
MEDKTKNQIAGAIIIAGLIIAGAILLKGLQSPVENNKFLEIELKAVKADEHITGNPNSKVIIIEYSDSECPFCKIFHNTMNQIIAQTSGKIAWVYRHYPIAQLHPKAFHEAVAMECAWEQGGNDSFWKYTNELFARTPSNNKLEVTELPKIAKDIGLNIDTFNTCLSTEKYSDKVKADMLDGYKAGIQGTPQSFILKNGKIVDIIQGAESFEVVMQKVKDALK